MKGAVVSVVPWEGMPSHGLYQPGYFPAETFSPLNFPALSSEFAPLSFFYFAAFFVFFKNALCYNFRMRKLTFIIAALLLALLSQHENAFAFAKGAEQECIKCHSLSADEAGTLLKALVPDIKVLEIKNGPVKGLWEVDFESGGKKSLFYVDFSKKNIVSGNIFDIKTKTNYTKDSFDKLNKVEVSQIPLDNALVLGDKNAKNKIIVFDDPE